jgi:hypothetical protein
MEPVQVERFYLRCLAHASYAVWCGANNAIQKTRFQVR